MRGSSSKSSLLSFPQSSKRGEQDTGGESDGRGSIGLVGQRWGQEERGPPAPPLTPDSQSRPASPGLVMASWPEQSWMESVGGGCMAGWAGRVLTAFCFLLKFCSL